jgi:endogenous inhibitor of DNA gyrase (YacG/DUF329 family)
MATEDRRCPSCGETVPAEEGQHAENLVSGQVRCPHCGEQVILESEARGEQGGSGDRAEAAPPGQHEDGDAFSGEETMEGLAEELRDKPQ